jgi:hypothetical protein
MALHQHFHNHGTARAEPSPSQHRKCQAGWGQTRLAHRRQARGNSRPGESQGVGAPEGPRGRGRLPSRKSRKFAADGACQCPRAGRRVAGPRAADGLPVACLAQPPEFPQCSLESGTPRPCGSERRVRGAEGKMGVGPLNQLGPPQKIQGPGMSSPLSVRQASRGAARKPESTRPSKDYHCWANLPASDSAFVGNLRCGRVLGG